MSLPHAGNVSMATVLPLYRLFRDEVWDHDTGVLPTMEGALCCLQDNTSLFRLESLETFTMVYSHNLVPVLAQLGLHLVLISTSWSGAAAGQTNGKSFEENLKGFASMAESLAGGLKTVSKAAKLLSGEIDVGEAEDCEFVCKNGATPRKKIGYVPEDNGCGAYGFKIDLSKLPQLERCCSSHDRCYGQCGMEKETCDLRFSQCLENVCNRLLKTMGLTDQESEGCMMTVQLMYMTVLELGCEAYLGAQRQACICKLEHDNRTDNVGTKRKTKVEL